MDEMNAEFVAETSGALDNDEIVKRSFTTDELLMGPETFDEVAKVEYLRDGLHPGERAWLEAWEAFVRMRSVLPKNAGIVRHAHHAGWWAKIHRDSSHLGDAGDWAIG